MKKGLPAIGHRLISYDTCPHHHGALSRTAMRVMDRPVRSLRDLLFFAVPFLFVLPANAQDLVITNGADGTRVTACSMTAVVPAAITRATRISWPRFARAVAKAAARPPWC